MGNVCISPETAANAIIAANRIKREKLVKSGKKLAAAGSPPPLPPNKNYGNGINTSLYKVKKDDAYVKRIDKFLKEQNLQQKVDEAFKKIHKDIKNIFKNIR